MSDKSLRKPTVPHAASAAVAPRNQPDLTRREFLTAIGGTASVLLAGCGGGGGGGGGTGGATLTQAQKSAMMTTVGQQYDTLPHASMDADNVQMLAYLKTRPELKSVQLTKLGTIAALFTDGHGFVFVNNMDDHNSDKRASVQLGTTASSVGTRAPDQIPGGKVVLLNALGVLTNGNPGSLANQFINEIRATAHLGKLNDMFQKTGGYQVTRDYASLINLRSIKQADLFYFIGHGGLGIDEKTKTQIFVLNSSDSVDDTAGDAALTDDLANGRVGYMLFTGTVLENGIKVRRWKKAYYITPAFVQTHMSFNKYSLVLINGCAAAGGSTPTNPAPGFKAAFFSGSTQASSYVSWDDRVNAGDVRDSAEFFFDRLMGASISSVTGVQAEPPVRPFDFTTTVTEMVRTSRSDQPYKLSQSLDTDPVAQGDPPRVLANLAAFANTADPDTFGLLAPTINSLQADMTAMQLVIRGQFGAVPGTVTLAGQTADGVTWGSSLITCTLPDHDAPNASGDVVVTVNGHKSNTARLTMWNITLHMDSHYDYSGTVVDDTVSGSVTYKSDLDLWIRGDAMGFRSNPPGIPAGATFGTGGFGITHPNPTKDAKLSSFSVSGTITHNLKFGDKTETVTETVSPVGAAPVPFDGSDSRVTGIDIVAGIIDPIAATLTFKVVAPLEGTVNSTVSSPDAQGIGTPSLGFIDHVMMSLDGGYGITAGSTTPYVLNGAQYTYTRTLSWDGTAAQSAPDATLERSANRKQTQRL